MSLSKLGIELKLTVEFAHADESVVDPKFDGAHGHGSVKMALRFYHLRAVIKVGLHGGDDAEQDAQHQEEDDEEGVLSH